MIVEPYAFVRGLTIGLATLWTIFGLVRLYRFAARWRDRLVPLGLPDGWLRRQLFVFVLRSTVLDPVNLGLLLFLFACWSLRLTVE